MKILIEDAFGRPFLVLVCRAELIHGQTEETDSIDKIKYTNSREGATDNSPAFQRRGTSGRRDSVPEGRLKSPQNVSRIVRNSVFLEKRLELLIKSALEMVFGLGMNVANRVSLLRDANRKPAVALLPRKTGRAGIIHPFGRTAFEKLHSLRQRHGGWKRNQHVDVIVGAADGESLETILAQCRRDRPKDRFASWLE